MWPAASHRAFGQLVLQDSYHTQQCQGRRRMVAAFGGSPACSSTSHKSQPVSEQAGQGSTYTLLPILLSVVRALHLVPLLLKPCAIGTQCIAFLYDASGVFSSADALITTWSLMGLGHLAGALCCLLQGSMQGSFVLRGLDSGEIFKATVSTPACCERTYCFPALQRT